MLHHIHGENQVPGLIFLQQGKIGILKAHLIISFDGSEKVIAIIYLLLLDIQTGDMSLRVALRQVIDILTETLP
jgi:hypothetical protein